MKPAKVYNILAMTAPAARQGEHNRGLAGPRPPRCQITPVQAGPCRASVSPTTLASAIFCQHHNTCRNLSKSCGRYSERMYAFIRGTQAAPMSPVERRTQAQHHSDAVTPIYDDTGGVERTPLRRYVLGDRSSRQHCAATPTTPSPTVPQTPLGAESRSLTRLGHAARLCARWLHHVRSSAGRRRRWATRWSAGCPARPPGSPSCTCAPCTGCRTGTPGRPPPG